MRPTLLAIIIAILLIPVVALVYTSSTAKKDTMTADPNPTATPAQTAADLVDPDDAVSAKKIVLETTKGDITITLFPDSAPKTVINFVTLGKRGYYNNVIFHRVIQQFVIQAGDPTGTGRGGESIYGATFPDEINPRKIVKGSLAMANAGPGTNGSQFFIVTEVDQPGLDGKHTNFGQVDPGSMGVVAAIAAVPVDENDKPTEEIKITGFRILE